MEPGISPAQCEFTVHSAHCLLTARSHCPQRKCRHGDASSSPITEGNAMRRRTLGNGAIIAASLLTLIGLGVAIANAATTTEDSPTGSECADVFLTINPAGDPVGTLCAAVDAD